MTMRTYRYFCCPNGHVGDEKTSENDQPFSTHWENVSTRGLTDLGKDKHGYERYACAVCGAEMKFTPEPPK